MKITGNRVEEGGGRGNEKKWEGSDGEGELI